jgi:hypothetical protein
VRVEIFIKYFTESVGKDEDLHKYIRRGVCEGGDHLNKSRFRYQCLNKFKLEYSNCKSQKSNSLKAESSD